MKNFFYRLLLLIACIPFILLLLFGILLEFFIVHPFMYLITGNINIFEDLWCFETMDKLFEHIKTIAIKFSK